MAITQDAVIHAPPPTARDNVRADSPVSLIPADRRAKDAFDATPAGRKLAAMQPRIDAITAAWSDAPKPEADARVNAAMSKAVDRFYGSDSEPEPEPVRLILNGMRR